MKNYNQPFPQHHNVPYNMKQENRHVLTSLNRII